MKKRRFEVVSKYKDKNIKLPKRATKSSAGYDIESAEDIVIPSIWKQVFDFSELATTGTFGDYSDMINFVQKNLQTITLKELIKKYNLRPVLVPTGIKVYIHNDEYLQLSNRSSNALNKGIIMTNGIGIIDADYVDNLDNEGEIFFQFLNFLPFDITIKKHDAIGQGVFKKYLLVDDDVAEGERTGGHGSTDDKN